MATTVKTAFNEFMFNSVNLDKDVVANARKSKDNILKNIHEFSEDNFFKLWPDIDFQFGSFARKTKCRELDDIDLMIGINAEGSTYDSSGRWDDITITVGSINNMQFDCSNDDGTLNSTMVLNKFILRLKSLRDYYKSEIHKNGEAVTVNLISKDWSFDIVPCFRTITESDGRNYYLIPNGKGKWKKTDPEIDKKVVTICNVNNGGKVLELVRLCKKWNRIKHVKTMDSYLLENIVVNYCKTTNVSETTIYQNFKDVLFHLKTEIFNSVYDWKEIQGNLNNLSYDDKKRISEKANNDFQKAENAIHAEFREKNHRKAINLWKDIFGEEFPNYGY